MSSKGIRFKNRNNEYIYPCPFYPIGSVYISVNSTNPSTYFGGTWQQIKDRFLLACGSTYSNGSTGGNAKHSHPLSANGGVPIRKYSDKFIQGRCTNAGKMPAQQSDGKYWITDANVDYSSSTIPHDTNMQGLGLYGNTDSTNILPPYLAVYVWERVS